jgi:transposase
VGVLTAMVFVTELGDLRRFANRRQVGSFLGLVPSSAESGQAADRKGHITHQGPSRVRKVLCQAVWSRLRSLESERQAYDRIVHRNPKHKKIAVVARMRALAVKLWHTGLAAQTAPQAEEVMT